MIPRPKIVDLAFVILSVMAGVLVVAGILLIVWAVF